MTYNLFRLFHYHENHLAFAWSKILETNEIFIKEQ